MSWNPWTDAAQLRAENHSLKQQLKDALRERDRERTISKVWHDANHRLVAGIATAERELAQAKAQMATMHRRDPATGRLLPRGK